MFASQRATLSIGWPPAPHDPRDRALACTLAGGWEVRCFARDDPRLGFCSARGLMHLQLWAPSEDVSVLTPSGLTRGAFELYPFEGWKLPVWDRGALARLLREGFGLELPSPARLRALERWYLGGVPTEIVGPAAESGSEVGHLADSGPDRTV